MSSTEGTSSSGSSPSVVHPTKTVDTVIEEDSESGGEGGSEDGEAGRVIVTEEQPKISRPVESNINQSTTSMSPPSISKDDNHSEDKSEDETGRQEVVITSDTISPQETTPISSSSTMEQKESTKITSNYVPPLIKLRFEFDSYF